MQLQVQAMFAAEFPAAREQDRAEARLAACKQMKSMDRHIAEHNREMAKSKRCSNSEAARLRLTSRAERTRFIDSCVDRLPFELQRGVCPPRAYLRRKLHKLGNMQLLQEEASAYCKDVVEPMAIDAGLRLAACWTA